MVEMTKDSKKAYRIFSYLRVQIPTADICTLRHLSVYIAKTIEEFDVYNDLQIFDNTKEDMCKLLLSNGTVLKFPKNHDRGQLNFVVEKNDKDVYMSMIVSTRVRNNLSTAYVEGIIGNYDFEYVVGSDYDNYFIKVYHNEKLQEYATSYFKTMTDDDIGLDCIDGLGYLTSVMTRIDLLYNNLRNVCDNKLVRRK